MHSRGVIALASMLWACGGGDGNGSGADASVDAPAAPLPFVMLAEPKLAADGRVRHRVIVAGTEADGSYATDDVVLSFDRPGAGSYVHPVVTLGPLGASSYFVACDIATPGCAGPLTLTAARASDPSVPVAAVDVELVDPLEVHPARRCLAGGNILHLEGNDAIFTGQTTLTDATWSLGDQFWERLSLQVMPSGATSSWQLTFYAATYAARLYPEVYDNARKWTGVVTPADHDHPLMNIRGFGQECSALSGRFTVADYQVDNVGVVRATIAFEQRCESSTTGQLSGCLHYER
jgi:hypothetical protein